MADVALKRSIPAAPRRRRAGRRFAWLEPWTYLSPALVLLALLMLVPLVVGMSYAFQQLQLLNPFKRGWVGFANLEAVFRDPVFWNALGNTVEWTFASLLLQFALGFGLALLLRGAVRRPPGRAGAGVRAVGGAELPLRPHLRLAVQPGDRAPAPLAGGA